MPFTSEIVGSIHEKMQEIVTMDDSSYRRNFDLDKKNETITIAGKSILISVKLQSSVANCCTMIFAVLV